MPNPSDVQSALVIFDRIPALVELPAVTLRKFPGSKVKAWSPCVFLVTPAREWYLLEPPDKGTRAYQMITTEATASDFAFTTEALETLVRLGAIAG